MVTSWYEISPSKSIFSSSIIIKNLSNPLCYGRTCFIS